MDQPATISGRTRLGLWFAFLGGAVAWLAHLLLAWMIAEFGCVSGLGERSLLGVSVVAWLIIVVSVAMVGLAFIATAVGWRLRARFPESETDTGAARGDAPYLAGAGLITSAIFVLIIAVQSVPILFYLWRC